MTFDLYLTIGQSMCIVDISSVLCFCKTVKNVFGGIDNIMSESGIPWSNVIGAMMDNCNVMHGQRTGFDALMKKKSPTLLDILTW